MRIVLDADATAERIEGLVHLDTQRARAGLDLTVARVARLTGPGALDFGGSEFEPARREPIEPELADPDDDYGWWELEPGSYLVGYNEAPALGDGHVGLVHALPRLGRAGASHAAFVIDGGEAPGGGGDAPEALLTVGAGGCRLKENCRISRLLVLETG